ncbi:hypothetical protein SteCoe_29489 [Stentor coeruleus]|uniref:Uncharacterized protein n=1 Tax=Stentor coeruleus TaxID=5963 RepID=A0A1R2B674_9CILI|nr:hypothetical protein SteCoe_29489 [Stentor coeruleus]
MNNYGQASPSETPYYPILGDTSANQFPPSPPYYPILGDTSAYQFPPGLPSAKAPGIILQYSKPIPIEGNIPLLPSDKKKGGEARRKRIIFASFITFLFIIEILCVCLLIFKFRFFRLIESNFTVKNSYRMITFIFMIGAGVLSIISLLLLWVKARKNKKISKWAVHGINLFAFLLYLFGNIIYYKKICSYKAYDYYNTFRSEDSKNPLGCIIWNFLCVYVFIYKLGILCIIS